MAARRQASKRDLDIEAFALVYQRKSRSAAHPSCRRRERCGDIERHARRVGLVLMKHWLDEGGGDDLGSPCVLCFS